MNKPTRIWSPPKPITVQQELLDFCSGNRLLANALVLRGFINSSSAAGFISPERYSPYPLAEISEINNACARIQKAIANKESILVWGDFDVDGQTSTAILVSTLQKIGADVQFHVPVRAAESHGIRPDVLEQFLGTGFNLLITCDTGISALPAVQLARSRAVDVVITDHHQLPEQLPDTQFIINPQLWQANHPLRSISGAGVAFILAAALLEKNNLQDEIPNLYDLTALGLVADVSTLINDARYFAQMGIAALRLARRPAIQKLLQNAEVDPTSFNEEHIGFALAPRLNAVGRLADANPAVQFLLSDDDTFLEEFSKQIEKLNGERKLLTSQVLGAACSQIESSAEILADPVLVLSGPNWPGGVLGPVASRLVDIYLKPVVLLTAGSDGTARGSARSIQGFDVTAAIAECKDILIGFGGHPMAAGLSLPGNKITEFRRRLNNTFKKTTKDLSASNHLEIEQYVELMQLDLDQVLLLEQLAPFGAGNPAPVFAVKNLVVEKINPLGKENEHLKVTVRDEHLNRREILWWQGAGSPLPEIDEHIDLACNARASTFRGRQAVQLEWVDWRPFTIDTVDLGTTSKYEIIDLRASTFTSFESYLTEDHSERLIFCEGVEMRGFSTVDRNHLFPAPELVIATIPPGTHEIKDVLDVVKPGKVVLGNLAPAHLSVTKLFGQILGMWKYAQSTNDFQLLVEKMAAKISTRKELILLCLTKLHQDQVITLNEQMKESSRLEFNSFGSQTDLQTRIKRLLNEIEEFRQFYLRANPQDVLG